MECCGVLTKKEFQTEPINTDKRGTLNYLSRADMPHTVTCAYHPPIASQHQVMSHITRTALYLLFAHPHVKFVITGNFNSLDLRATLALRSFVTFPPVVMLNRLHGIKVHKNSL